jgi:predicted AAA+ superfamily ATPase
MPNWYSVAPPHNDIKQGDFDESVFAAKLGDVVTGDAPPDYNDPYAFFQKTYLTKGLENLLQSVHRKLEAGKGPGVVELQTPFGGGKTHALILVYHYLKNGHRVEEKLPDGVGLLSPNVSAIVGTDANPSEGFRSGDVVRRTLWGEIAYQLGGQQAYSAIANNDEDRVSPGRDDFQDVLEPLQPFTILLDEVVEYVVKARGVGVGGTTLGAETLTFLKELSGAVSSLENGLLLATLPSSEKEDFGEKKQQNLAKAEKILGREEAIYTPVEGEEIYSIIRRRLFERPDEAKVRSVVDEYVQTYQKNKNDLPGKATSGDFRHKMELSYPFHPEVIDILYEKWSTFSSFQRTRGALRLLARVAEDLYQREEAIDLILPGDINLGESSIREEFLRHLGNEYEGVIASDVAGGNAKSQRLDAENKSWDHLAQRNATSIFLHSFAADQNERGIDLPYIKLDVARSDTPLTLVTDVLQKQRQDLWYLNTRGDQEYFFSNVPNLNRVVIDKKSQVQRTSVRKELKTRIESELGSKLRTYLWPSSGDKIPDNQELKLAVLDPDENYDDRELRRWIDRKGQSYRTYKNTLIFAVPDKDRHVRFENKIKDYLALQEIADSIDRGDYSALEEQKDEIQRRIKDLSDDFPRKVREMYQVAKVPVMNGDSLEEIDFGQPAVGRENLDTWFRRKLTSQMHGKILGRPPSANLIRSKFLNNGDEIGLSDILEQFYRNPDLPALDDPQLIAESIANGVQDGSFGLAREENGKLVPSSVKINQPLSTSQVNFHEEGWVLVTASKAEDLQEEVQTEPLESGETDVSGSEDEAGFAGGGSAPSPGEDGTPTETGSGEDEPEPEEEMVQQLSLRISGVPTGKLNDLHRGVLRPLIREAGEFEFTIEFEVKSDDGISEKTIEQQVMETLRQLGVEAQRQQRR